MGKTIIQPIGPLYGEVVNGTVYGRPNGSIYIPSSNTIDLDMSDTPVYVKNDRGRIYFCDENGVENIKAIMIAQSQDNASYMRLDISESSEFTTYKTRILNAGQFNSVISFTSPSSPYTIVAEQTYYLRAVLVASTNVDVAVSDTVEATGYVSE